MALILTIKDHGEKVLILDNNNNVLAKIFVTRVQGNQVRLGFENLPNISIQREKRLNGGKINDNLTGGIQ